MSIEVLNQSEQYDEMGYCCIALHSNSKVPVEKWKWAQVHKPPRAKRLAWWGITNSRDYGIALVTGKASGGLYVKDFDDLNAGQEFHRRFRDWIRTVVLTPRPGMHFYFRKVGARNSQRESIDGRGEGGLVAAPPTKGYSFLDGHGLVRPEELCELPDELLPAHGTLQRSIDIQDDRLRMVDRALKYAETMEIAVSGQRGHDKLLRFCSKLLWRPPLGFGLTTSEAWPIAQAYSRRCLPPWNDRDILRKFGEALKNQPPS